VKTHGVDGTPEVVEVVKDPNRPPLPSRRNNLADWKDGGAKRPIDAAWRGPSLGHADASRPSSRGAVAARAVKISATSVTK
jgi:hypothetical protein